MLRTTAPLVAAWRRCHTALPRPIMQPDFHSTPGCGSTTAPLVQRGDSMAKPCRGDCRAGQMIQPGAAASLGSEDTGSIPQSAFADSSLCTREVRWPDGHTVFALARCACLGKESMTAQALGLPSAAAQYGSSVTLLAQRGSAVWVQRHAAAGD